MRTLHDAACARLLWVPLLATALGSTSCLGPQPPRVPAPTALASTQFTQATPLPALVPEHTSAPDPATSPAGARTLSLDEALELGGASNLQVAYARESVAEARAELDLADALWLPDLRAGLGYESSEGARQRTEGDIIDVSRNAGFVGAGLFATFDFADALLDPRAAQHDLDAAAAEVSATVNDTLLAIALAYSNLLEAQARLALSEEVVDLARELVTLAEAFSHTGTGLEADAARARNELARRRRLTVAAEEAIAKRSARLATLLRLDPSAPLRAGEALLVPIALVPEDADLPALIQLAQAARSDLAALQSVVQAQVQGEEQESLRPFIPSLHVGVSGGGLGGGTGSDFEDFSEAGQWNAALVWNVRNLGLGESATRRGSAARTRRAQIQLQIARDNVAEQVAVAFIAARQGRRQVELALENVRESRTSLDLNMRRIREAEGLPIEALQAIQAAATARDTWLEAVGEFNRSQFQLLRAVGSAARP